MAHEPMAQVSLLFFFLLNNTMLTPVSMFPLFTIFTSLKIVICEICFQEEIIFELHVFFVMKLSTFDQYNILFLDIRWAICFVFYTHITLFYIQAKVYLFMIWRPVIKSRSICRREGGEWRKLNRSMPSKHTKDTHLVFTGPESADG